MIKNDKKNKKNKRLKPKKIDGQNIHDKTFI